MTTEQMRGLQSKFDKGQLLTDAELKELHKFYRSLVDALDTAFLPKYHIMQVDAWQVLRRLEEMQNARK